MLFLDSSHLRDIFQNNASFLPKNSVNFIRQRGRIGEIFSEILFALYVFIDEFVVFLFNKIFFAFR